MALQDIVVLPTFSELIEKNQRGEIFSAMEEFIYRNAPIYGTTQEAQWRALLSKVLSEVHSGVGSD